MTSPAVTSRCPPPLAYFYCEKGSAEAERSDPTEVLRSIARQLSGDDPRTPVRLPLISKYNNFTRPGVRFRRLDIEECIQLILDLTEDNPATIVVDALDEVDASARYKLLDAFDQIIGRSTNIVKIFASSRDDGDIVCRLAESPNLYISAKDNEGDIDKFVDDQLAKAIGSKRLLNGNVSPILAKTISEVLKRDSNAM